MVESQLIELALNAGAVVIVAVAILYMQRTNARTQENSGSLQTQMLEVLTKQMAYEDKRDEREDKRLEESKKRNREDKRHNEVMEHAIKTMATLLEHIDKDNTEIKQVVGHIFTNQEAIIAGVDAMNTNERDREFQKIIELLGEISAKLDKVLDSTPPSPTAAPDPDKTQKIPPPDLTTVAQEKEKSEPPLVHAANEPPKDVNIKIDKEDNE